MKFQKIYNLKSRKTYVNPS
jgi:hypothetical protein